MWAALTNLNPNPNLKPNLNPNLNPNPNPNLNPNPNPLVFCVLRSLTVFVSPTNVFGMMSSLGLGLRVWGLGFWGLGLGLGFRV